MEVITQQTITFRCVEAIQPIGKIYIGVMDCDHLEYISYADVRRLELGQENREVEDYIGIQRQLNSGREKEIGKYVNLVDASFPNSIIITIPSEFATYDEDTSNMTIVYKDNVAKVLDGQHRIAGLRHFKGEGKNFQVVVSIYLDMELEDQAIVFSTINKEQKSVSNSLVADLFAFAESRSPQKTAHNIARALNRKDGGPFYKKIKILGTANHKEIETITQDTFVKNLIAYISKEPQKDRDFYKRNKDKPKESLDLVSGEEQKRLFLRNIFIEDLDDIKIAQIISNYFKAVQKRWPTAWGPPLQDGIILSRSTGFIALMRFLKNAYLSFNRPSEVITMEEFYSIFHNISLTDADFNKDRYLPGSTGQAELFKDFKNLSGL